MGKSVKNKLGDAKKWLGKNSDIGVTVKPALASIEKAEKVIADVASLRNQLSAAIALREQALVAFKTALGNVRQEKKLKAKEQQVKARLANLTGTSA